MRIGIDVGGTNTDAVLMDGAKVLASIKRPTTEDVGDGIAAGVKALLERFPVPRERIDAVMIGTTHFTNAFVQGRGLARVAAIRIGYPASRSIPPFAAWPSRLRDPVTGPTLMTPGGFQFDGREMAPLDTAALRRFAHEIRDAGITEIAVTSVFAQVNAKHEIEAAAVIADALPGVGITLSSEVGRTGLIERENAAIMNASLRPLGTRVAGAFRSALAGLGIDAPFFVSQNDGTLMSAEQMQRYPVLTFAAGPTNSLRGAYLLTGFSDALVADIGGTTSDIGVLAGGFPRQSTMHVDIGGIRTNFRMPDIISIGLGGGSRVRPGRNALTIGPDSMGYRIGSESLIFGGDTLTATDLAVAAGYADIGDPAKVAALTPEVVEQGVREMHRLLGEALDRMKTSRGAVPLILVGGGAALIGRPLPGISEIISPAEAGVANAVGAAIGQVGGEIDRIYDCDTDGREAALADARCRATDAAVAAGADRATVTITDMEDLPLQYLPGGARRLICRAVGELAVLKDGRHG